MRRAIRKDLHFGSQIHQKKPKTNATYLVSRTAAVSSDERKGGDVMHPIAARQKEKEGKRHEWKDNKREMYGGEVAEDMETKAMGVRRGGPKVYDTCLMPVVGVGSV
ncbi:hypothetical protein HOY80DRAFT_1109910 [Tuber brumale]|nr:hypothetical protein HOY80DRAFT_1109910 [Tuber brumale]